MKKFMFLAVLGLLGGCGGENNGSTQKDNSVQKANADKSSTNYQIKVATTGVQPPFSYLDEKGNLIGMDIEIIKAIGEVQGFDIKFETMSWADMLPSVGAGKNDLAISGVSYNDERNEAYTLSKKYLHVPSAIMVVDPSIQSLSDLGGKRFDCMTGAKQCQDISTAVPTATIHENQSTFLTFKSLAQGKTDAIGEDKQLLEYFAVKYPEVKTHIIAYETESNPQSAQVIVAGKGKDELIGMINEGIDKLIASGKIAEIEKKWLENPY